jgi:pyruvate/2-oxoglutarate dehydrogenase complex dihydrolipoamide dehydrogenase (E3) component
MYSYAIIGFGPAGILTLAQLPQSQLSETLILENSCVGGDLYSLYGDVIANITTQEIVNAFRKVQRWESKPMPILNTYAPEQCPKLADACKQMIELVSDDMRKADYRNKQAESFQHTDRNTWIIKTVDNQMFETKKLILCVGVKPKTLDLPIISIPLSIALSKKQLESHVTKANKVVVFGTSHSGALILKNLKDLGVSRVTAIYNSAKPFYFARDGDTEGIKQEAATIADEIIAKAWGESTPQLINYCDFSTVYRAVYAADRVIYAIGFGQPKLTYTNAQGQVCPLVPNKDLRVWGFGLAFPSKYTAPNGNQYNDIGFSGFIDAIKNELSNLVQ